MKWLGMGLLCFLVSPLWAQHGDEKAGNAEEQAMMEAWMKAGAPGEHHEVLKQLAGKWTVKCKMRQSPDQPWAEMDATSEGQMILGGRYVVEVFRIADFMGFPFEGHSLMGYDNHKEKYFTLWIDSTSTAAMSQSGTIDADHKVITTSGEYYDPMVKAQVKSRTVTAITSHDSHTMSMHTTYPGAEEFHSMDLVFTRAK